MAYQGPFTFRWRRVLAPAPSVAAVLILLVGSVLTTAPAPSLGPVPAAAAATNGPALETDQPPASLTRVPDEVGPALVGPAPAVAKVGVGSVRQTVLPSSSWSVPDQLLAAYRKAVAGAPPACHLPVSLLAAIGQVESGSLAGRSIDTAHRVVPPVLGPLLDGVSFAAIPDTDGGRLDGNPRWDRAVGPMQFIPSTWAGSGVDGDGDGQADPQNVYDATASAAGYLCAHGRDLALDSGLRSAILSYNHSDAYLADVLDWARRFGAPSGDTSRATSGGLTVPANFTPANPTPSNRTASGTTGASSAHPSPSNRTASGSTGSSSSPPTPSPDNDPTVPTTVASDPAPTFEPGPADPTSTDPVVASDGPGSPQPVPVAGIALSPRAGRDFGDQRLGVTSDELALTIQNPGTAPLTFTGPPALSSSDFALAGHGDCTDPIAPEGSCTLHVTFRPSALGAHQETLTMYDSAPGGPHSYNVTGVGVQPAVTLAPTALSFGQVPVGDTDKQVVTLRNAGTAVLTVTDLSSSNAGVSLTSTDALPFTVAPGAVASLKVAFAPNAVGAVTATISVTDDAPGSPQSVSVTGSGQARADLAVDVVASLTSPTSKSSLTYTITLNNNGPSDATAVRVVDTLPEEVTFTSVSAPDGVRCTTPDVDTTATVVCTLATLESSATPITIKIVTTVAAHARWSFINTAVVSSTTPDPVAANNTATVTGSVFGKE